MFKALLKKAEEVRRATDPYLLMLELSKDKEFTKLITDLNTESQLYDEGINSEGEKLSDVAGGYSAYTIRQKELKGQPIDRVTLKDTGRFYRSFRVTFIDGDLSITAFSLKESRTGTIDLRDVWGPEIIGLTEDNLDLVITVALKKVKENIKRNLKIAA